MTGVLTRRAKVDTETCVGERNVTRLPPTNQGERPGADLTLTVLRRNQSGPHLDFRPQI